MRIAFCYPPYTKDGKFPTLPQNRQFIYTASKEVKIFPVVMATAATWAQELGHEVLWLDGVTRRMNWSDYERELKLFSPELIVLEGKTPIMSKLWNYVNSLKANNRKLKTVLVGDHVSLFPEESFHKCEANYILVGGDYDFLLANLLKHFNGEESLEAGVWTRQGNGGKLNMTHDLNKAPLIDRELTRWQDYGEAYLFKPCAYIMSGRGCGIDKERTGVCSFCVWQHALWGCQARLRSPEHVVKEVKKLFELGVKEIFDDAESGALWNYSWLEKFYQLLTKEKLLGKVSFSSNARGDQLEERTCQLLKKLNYRLLKVGLESGSNRTLEKIGKRETLEQIIQGVKNAKDAGLRVMLTIMVGYPWEEEKEVEKTFEVAKRLLLYKTKAGDCLQSSVVTPYPGTPLWYEAKREKWLKIEPDNYQVYDMSKPILKAKYNAARWCQRIWSLQKLPAFVLKSGLSIRRLEELKVLTRGARSLLGHTRDYHK